MIENFSAVSGLLSADYCSGLSGLDWLFRTVGDDADFS